MATVESQLAQAMHYHRCGNLQAAERLYRHILQADPSRADVHNLLGGLAFQKKDYEQAAVSIRQALTLSGAVPVYYSNLATVLAEQAKLDEAIAHFREALRLGFVDAETHLKLGNALGRQGKIQEAIHCFRQAIQLMPDYEEAFFRLGNALLEQGEWQEAAANFQQALRINPNSAMAHNALGSALSRQGQLAEAVACYRRAVQLQPESPAALGKLVHNLQHLCLWEELGPLSQRFIASALADGPGSTVEPAVPFDLLSLATPTTPAQQCEVARRWAERHFKPAANGRQPRAGPTRRRANSRLTIGYLSCDFHAHATAYLIAEMIEKHDRQRFTVLGYSYGRDDHSPMRQRMVKAFDRFIDVKDASFAEAAKRIAEDEVDILIDLKGYTGGARTQIMALRPAPIQVSYLGYVGTMAAPFMDYIVVDDFVVPLDQQPFFTEKLVHLPGCYYVHDSQREIAPETPTRAACGLPEQGFVFCCFNNNSKITPEMFDVWMKLLRAVPGSVLWLLEGNRFAPVNLRKEAQARGVAPQRLVFAPRTSMQDHLARHRLADLFLDTIPYNAHTTASDALWAGCPVLTVTGQTFASRVAGSMLRTLGLPELITTALDEYQALALRLAQDAGLLAGLRARVEANRMTSGLFDGGLFAKRLEKAIEIMWDIHAAREAPRAFAVAP